MDKLPLVLDSNAEVQQLQNADNLSLPTVQQQLDNHTMLIKKIVFELSNLGITFSDPDLLNLLNS